MSVIGTPSGLYAVGLGRETAYGNATPSADLLPWAVSTPQPAISNQLIPDASWRGLPSAYAGMLEGPISSTLTLDGACYPDSIGLLLAGILGADSVAGSGPYTHTISAKTTDDQQPPSLVIIDSRGNAWPGQMIQSVQIDSSDPDGLLTVTAQTQGKQSTSAGTQTVPAPSTAKPFIGWQGSCTINDEDDEPRLTAATIQIARTLTPIRSVDGSRDPRQIWSDQMVISGALTIATPATLDLDTKSRGATSTFIALTWTNGSLSLELYTRVIFQSVNEIYGSDWIETTAQFTMINPSGNPIVATLINKQEGSYV